MTTPKPSKTICLTGGGTAGHVMPHIALLPALRAQGYNIVYIGSQRGIERRLMQQHKIPYTAICTGKLRRHLDWRNGIMPIMVYIGVMQSFWCLSRHRPQVIFSKGGFVALPVVVAAWLCRIPVVAHESDLSPGLANRLSMPFVKKLCVGFKITQQRSRHPNKTIWTGTPIRRELMAAQVSKGLAITGLNQNKPIVMVIGGSLGARAINDAIVKQLDALLSSYQIIHICGDQQSKAMPKREGYRAFDFVYDELGHLFACADCVVSRAGANSLAELIALRKPHILIPLPKAISRGDQLQNAAYMKSLGISMVLPQEKIQEGLLPSIASCLEHKDHITQAMTSYSDVDAIEAVMGIINNVIPAKA